MLKTVETSSNSKTGPIAVTYRAGEHETYGTCPKTCKLHPKSETGTDNIDSEYLQAVYDSVPRDGLAWAYSHFPAAALPKPAANKTLINASCDTVADAVASVKAGQPAVYAAPYDSADQWPKIVEGVRFYRCPAEMSDSFTCMDCGSGTPLCARNRSDVIVFVGHGTGKKRVGTDAEGGCYAASGPTAVQWHATKKKGAPNDAQALRDFSRKLRRGSMLRHHIAGDIGRATA